jgi:hypothetical protein
MTPGSVAVTIAVTIPMPHSFLVVFAGDIRERMWKRASSRSASSRSASSRSASSRSASSRSASSRS